jgi:hypothetical protein
MSPFILVVILTIMLSRSFSGLSSFSLSFMYVIVGLLAFGDGHIALIFLCFLCFCTEVYTSDVIFFI